jgi:tetratricopeptide (TPR) repeat protein
MRCWPASLAVACLAVVPAVAQEPHHHVGESERLGTVRFAVSCNAAASASFLRGVAMLHSFEYDHAEKTFASAAAADPACAMAHWGIAMSLYHPVWAAGNPSAAPSPADLRRGAEELAKARSLGRASARERDFIEALEAFYRDAQTVDHKTRAHAFAEAMAGLDRRYPEDEEAAVFHAVALLGTADPRDKTYALQKDAAGILNGVLERTPEHPGVAHYLIHSFDYPPLASVALPAARAYAKIAPSSPHALHMPSHIFTRLGLWPESVESNLASAAAARRDALAGSSFANFEELHANDYLAYAYLQRGQDDEVKAVLERMLAVNEKTQFGSAYAYAAVGARYALERRSWAEAAALQPRATFDWSRFPYAEAITHFARAVGGARSGQLDVSRAAIERLAAIEAVLIEKKELFWADHVEIERLAAAAWLARAEGKNDEAERLLRSAAELEDRTEKHPVTPGPVLPAREQLADLLMDLGRPADALTEYQAVLVSSPGRLQALYGAGHAAELAGRAEQARTLYAQLLAGTDPASRRAELVAARRYARAATAARD